MHCSHRFSVGLLALALTALAFGTAAAGPASSISVGPSRISADQPLTPGQTYALPAHTVTNGSADSLLVKITPSDFRDREHTLAPPDWFRAEPAQFVLGPGQSRSVLVRAALPPDAPPGNFRIWFRFHGEPEGATGLAVATDVEVSFLFDVGQPSAFPGLSRLTAVWGAAALLVLAVGARWWAVSRRRPGTTTPRHPPLLSDHETGAREALLR